MRTTGSRVAGVALGVLVVGALMGATTGMTTRQARTAAPGAVNLGGVSAAEGSSLSFARADHTHSVTGTVASATTATTLSGGSYAQSTGLSTSWGITNGTNTGGFNTIMGTGGSATWLVSGTSGGVFRGGLQVIDGGGYLRLYAGSDYLGLTPTGVTFNGSTIWHAGNDGAGSSLDADKLDGLEPSALAVATATALAANGANCAAGQAPLGVNASGAVESCWTPAASVHTHVGGDVTSAVANATNADMLDGLDTSASATSASVVTRDANGRTSAKGWTVFSTLTDLTNDAPWYGVGISNTADAGGYRVQLAGFYGVQIKTGGIQLTLPNSGTTTLTGDFLATGNVTAYGSVSDLRLKRNVEPIHDALAKALSIHGVTHEWREDKLAAAGFRPTPGRVHGLIAQDVQRILSDAVFDAPGQDGVTYLGVRYERVVPLLVEAIRELEARVAALEKARGCGDLR